MITNLTILVMLMRFPSFGGQIYEAQMPSMDVYPTIPAPIETELIPRQVKRQDASTINIAEAYIAQKRFNEAEAVLKRAAARMPANGDIYYGLALAYFEEKRFDEAEAAALEAHMRAHRIADVHLILAKIYARKHPERVAGQLELYLDEAPNAHQSKRVRKMLK
jgi:tetratricopeptide (TPR) repeat protein